MKNEFLGQCLLKLNDKLKLSYRLKIKVIILKNEIITGWIRLEIKKNDDKWWK